jgi:hypothetical protein
MDDPFSNLRKEREPSEEEKKVYQQKEHQKVDTYYQYQDMVLEVLRQLQSAGYPKESVVFSYVTHFWHKGWAIAQKGTGPATTFLGRSSKEIFVGVDLEFDDQDNPIRFRCFKPDWRGYREESANLSKEDLIRALNKLHKH